MANQPWGAPATQAPPQQTATQSQAPAVSDIIAKAAVRGKFLDFRNGLVLATPQDYAMVHGIGGKDHAPRSVIRCLITDYSSRPATTVSANLSPELFPYIISVCEKNASVTSASPAPLAQSPGTALAAQLSQFTGHVLTPELVPGKTGQFVAVPAPVLKDLQGLSQDGDAAATAIINSVRGTKPLPADASGVDYIAVQLNLLNVFIQQANAETVAKSSGQGGVDFSYKQDRVNVYKEANGFCPVSVISINRMGLRKNGEVSRLPWTVSIQNFLAPPIKNGGTTAYNARQMKDKHECSVSISDFDMFRCCYRVCRFIELWEQMMWLPVFQQGFALKEQQRQQSQPQQNYY